MLLGKRKDVNLAVNAYRKKNPKPKEEVGHYEIGY
jgi:hypothetical protein